MKGSLLLYRGMVCIAVTFGMAAAALADEETGADVVQLVVELLADKDKDVRALGLEQVRTAAKGQAATKQFAAQLAKLPAEAQAGLLSALADRGDAAARPDVLALLSSSREEPVRVAAIGAVGALGEPADVKLLVQLLGAASKAANAAARASLMRLPGEDVPAAIVTEMKQAASPIRAALIDILATRRAKSAIPDMLQAAVQADPTVRAAAMAALGQLASAEHIPGMVQGVLKAAKGAERDAAERAVTLVCNRITDEAKRAEQLLAAMSKLAEAERRAMLSTLGRVGGPTALRVVEEAIAQSEPELHASGLRALCNWPDATIASRLIELTNTDQHAEHRALALAALIRVAPLPDKRPASQRLELLQKALTMCTRDEERNLVLRRARAIRTVQTLRFLAPYMEQPEYAQQACESVVELAHHRELREPNKAEFHRALDKVIQISKDAVVAERANRYKANQTWAKPMAPQRP